MKKQLVFTLVFAALSSLVAGVQAKAGDLPIHIQAEDSHRDREYRYTVYCRRHHDDHWERDETFDSRHEAEERCEYLKEQGFRTRIKTWQKRR